MVVILPVILNFCYSSCQLSPFYFTRLCVNVDCISQRLLISVKMPHEMSTLTFLNLGTSQPRRSLSVHPIISQTKTHSIPLGHLVKTTTHSGRRKCYCVGLLRVLPIDNSSAQAAVAGSQWRVLLAHISIKIHRGSETILQRPRAIMQNEWWVEKSFHMKCPCL
jgi:hypothetical protein